MASTRRLAAIMFTDIVGFTASAQTDEGTALKLLHEQERLLRPVLKAHHGREIKSTGDGFLVEFDSALHATECAIDIQRHVHERNSRAKLRPLELRIGVHVGDVEERAGDIFGDAVNVASRIHQCAVPGGVCISGSVFDQVRNKIPNRLERLPPTALKHVRMPVDLYRVTLPWESRAAPIVGATSPRLAVLPLANISPDPKDEYFAEGLTEELIGALSKIPELRVIARTSVGQYKSTSKTVAQIGAELDVASLLEGSVRKAGNRLRITLQLVDVTTQEHVWSNSYDRELDDVFAIQADVASQVASSLAHRMPAKEPVQDTTDLEAYLSYLRALQLLHEATEASLREALRLFDHAIEQDPTFARAFAGVARAWNAMVSRGYQDYVSVGAKAERAARKALELAPDSAEAHAALAEVHGMLDRFLPAIAEAERAIEINPNLSEAYEILGRQLTLVRGPEAGLAALRKAHELNPLGVRSALVLAWVTQLAGHEGEAFDLLERLSRLNPSDPRVCDGLGEYYQLKGDFLRAREALDRGLKTTPDDEALRVDRAVVCAASGDRKEAERELRELEGVSTDAGRLNARLFIRASLGDLDEAFDALAGLAELHAWPFVIGVHPTFAAMRKDPRFDAFRVRVGLPA